MKHDPVPPAVPGLMTSLVKDAQELGEDELRVLVQIASRLRQGREEYGALSIASDPRDWMGEACAEYLDASVYLAVEMLRRRG